MALDDITFGDSKVWDLIVEIPNGTLNAPNDISFKNSKFILETVLLLPETIIITIK